MIIIVEAKIVWARKGKKIAKKVRCTSGTRKGRVVSSARSCSKRIDVKKRLVLRRTKAKYKTRMITRAKRTKKFNPLSKRIARLNKTIR